MRIEDFPVRMNSPTVSLPKPSAQGKAGKAPAEDEIIKTKRGDKISGKN
jgi:hypothetical protein